MKRKNLAILSGTLALALALAPAAFAVPSVEQEGSVQVDTSTTVTTEDGTEVKTEATVAGEDSEDLEVVITGSTGTTDAATTPAQAAANKALAEANATGNTVESMVATNSEISTALAAAGVTSSDTVVVSNEFYLGIVSKKDGEAKSGTASAVISMPSEAEVNNIVAVLVYNSSAKKWDNVSFSKSGNKIVIKSGKNGAYRFVSKV